MLKLSLLTLTLIDAYCIFFCCSFVVRIVEKRCFFHSPHDLPPWKDIPLRIFFATWHDSTSRHKFIFHQRAVARTSYSRHTTKTAIVFPDGVPRLPWKYFLRSYFKTALLTCRQLGLKVFIQKRIEFKKMNVITTARRMRGSSSSSKAFARRRLSMTLTTGRSGTSVVIISRHFTDGAETNQCLKAKSQNSLLKGFWNWFVFSSLQHFSVF